MTKMEFLQNQITDVELKIIKELEGVYYQHGLEETIGELTMTKLRGYFFMRDELENDLQYEIEEGQYKEEGEC